MFAKKLLSVVALLFLGSQSVYAQQICKPTYDGNDCTATGCGENDNGKIYLTTYTDGEGASNIKTVKVSCTPQSAASCSVDESVSEGTDYCVDANGKIWERKEALCNAPSDCTYYTKDASGWKVTNENVPREDPVCNPASCSGPECICETGYHLVGGNSLYQCTKGTSCESKTGENIPIGLLRNAGAAASYIECKFSGGSRVCSAATITAAGGSTDADCSAVGLYHAYTGGKINLCLDAARKISVDLETDTDADNTIDSVGKYILPLGKGAAADFLGINRDANTNLFTTLDVDAKGNVKVFKAPAKVRYRYTATDTATHKSSLYRIYGRDEAQLTENKGADKICATAGAKPFEFMYVESTFTIASGLSTNIDYYVEGYNEDLAQ